MDNKMIPEQAQVFKQMRWRLEWADAMCDEQRKILNADERAKYSNGLTLVAVHASDADLMKNPIYAELHAMSKHRDGLLCDLQKYLISIDQGVVARRFW